MADNVAAGWHPDPTSRFELRYWDGQRWTEHVSTAGSQATDAIDAAVAQTSNETDAPAASAVSPASTSGIGIDSEQTGASGVPVHAFATEATHVAGLKVNAFNAKRVAIELQGKYAVVSAELTRLQRIVSDLGALDMAERQRRIEEQRQAEEELRARIEELRRQLSELDQRVIVNRDRLVLEEVGLFDFEHAAEASATLATELEVLRSQIRQANKLGSAITAAQNFTFNNSAAKGRTFVNQMSRIMLRAYNAEAENAVKTVKAGNLASAQKRLSAARDQIARQGQMIDLSVTDHYHRLRLRELELASRHLQAVAAEKELDRERRAELREQRALEQKLSVRRNAWRRNARTISTRSSAFETLVMRKGQMPSKPNWIVLTPRSPRPTTAQRTYVLATCTSSPTSAPSAKGLSRSA